MTPRLFGDQPLPKIAMPWHRWPVTSAGCRSAALRRGLSAKGHLAEHYGDGTGWGAMRVHATDRAGERCRTICGPPGMKHTITHPRGMEEDA